MRIIRTKQFSKKILKLSTKIKSALTNRLRIFAEDPYHVILNNHALSGEFENYRSINITGDYRLIYEFLDEDTIRLIYIDTHHNLYEN